MSIMLCSCATTYKAHKISSLTSAEVAYLVRYNKFEYKVFSINTEELIVVQIDGKKLIRFNNPKLIEVLPGKHILTVSYIETKHVGNTTRTLSSRGSLPAVLNAEKGHTYAIKPVLMQKDGEKTWKPVVEDITGKKGDPRIKGKKG